MASSASIINGGYESAFLRRMRRSGSDTKFVDELMACSVNVLSLVHSHVYFPTYSNGLKEVGGYLDCQWTDHAASGLTAVYLGIAHKPACRNHPRLSWGVTSRNTWPTA